MKVMKVVKVYHRVILNSVVDISFYNAKPRKKDYVSNKIDINYIEDFLSLESLNLNDHCPKKVKATIYFSSNQIFLKLRAYFSLKK